jgi:hypothetical protein
VAACVEAAVDRDAGEIRVLRSAFEGRVMARRPTERRMSERPASGRLFRDRRPNSLLAQSGFAFSSLWSSQPPPDLAEHGQNCYAPGAVAPPVVPARSGAGIGVPIRCLRGQVSLSRRSGAVNRPRIWRSMARIAMRRGRSLCQLCGLGQALACPLEPNFRNSAAI